MFVLIKYFTYICTVIPIKVGTECGADTPYYI